MCTVPRYKIIRYNFSSIQKRFLPHCEIACVPGNCLGTKFSNMTWKLSKPINPGRNLSTLWISTAYLPAIQYMSCTVCTIICRNRQTKFAKLYHFLLGIYDLALARRVGIWKQFELLLHCIHIQKNYIRRARANQCLNASNQISYFLQNIHMLVFKESPINQGFITRHSIVLQYNGYDWKLEYIRSNVVTRRKKQILMYLLESQIFFQEVYFTCYIHLATQALVTSVPKKSKPRAVVTHYCPWYTFLEQTVSMKNLLTNLLYKKHVEFRNSLVILS